MALGKGGRVRIRIAQNLPSRYQPDTDTQELAAANAAEVRSLNFSHILGSGILHTKLWIVDRRHVYVGSANLDWRSLTQVKELGFAVYNCSCLADDMWKIFQAYWILGRTQTV